MKENIYAKTVLCQYKHFITIMHIQYSGICGDFSGQSLTEYQNIVKIWLYFDKQTHNKLTESYQ